MVLLLVCIYRSLNLYVCVCVFGCECGCGCECVGLCLYVCHFVRLLFDVFNCFGIFLQCLSVCLCASLFLYVCLSVRRYVYLAAYLCVSVCLSLAYQALNFRLN